MLIQVSLKAVHKKCAKKAVTLTSQKSPLGVSLSLNHTHMGLRGLILVFRQASPSLLRGSLPRDCSQHQRKHLDDFGGHLVLHVEAKKRNISNEDRNVILVCKGHIPSILKDGITYV